MSTLITGPLLTVHPATVAAEAARRTLAGEAYNTLSLSRVLRSMATDELAALDQVYVPHWYFRMCAEMEDSVRKYHALDFWLVVEAISGAVWQTNQWPPFQEVAVSSVAPAVALEPTLTREEAEPKAMESFRWDVIFRGRMRARLLAKRLVEARLVHVPFWVGYFTGPGGQLRARVVHGLEGRVVDNRSTDRILEAMKHHTGGQLMQSHVDQGPDADADPVRELQPTADAPPAEAAQAEEEPYLLPYIYGSAFLALIGALVLIGAVIDQGLLWAKILVAAFLFIGSLLFLRKYNSMRRKN